MTPETVRVRIAVAVDPSGDWNAVGWKDASERRMTSVADNMLRPALFWVEADLPIPATVTVEGEVSA